MDWCGAGRIPQVRLSFLIPRGQVSDGLNVDIHFVAHPKKKRAGVFQAPLLVGDYEMRAGAQLITGFVYFKDQRDQVIGPVKIEYSLDLDLRVRAGIDAALDLCGRESRFRELLALQNVLVHFPVAHAATAIAAGHVHHHQAPGLSRAWIKLNCPAL